LCCGIRQGTRAGNKEARQLQIPVLHQTIAQVIFTFAAIRAVRLIGIASLI
jgi:hypothetical protein